MTGTHIDTQELSTNEKRDLVAAAASDDYPSPEALDAEIYRLVAAENHESDYTHDPEILRSQVYSALLSKIATQAGIDIDVDVPEPVANAVRTNGSTESTDETDDGSDWASPLAASRSKEIEAEAQDRATDDEEGWPSATASKRSAELEEDN